MPARTPRRKFPVSTVLALVLLPLVGLLTYTLFNKWNATRLALAAQRQELETLTARNAVLARAYDVLQNRKFQVCNKSPYPLNVAWVSAAYSDGRHLRHFDSARCPGWQEQEIAAGENKNLLLSSTEEGCNWNGNVIYFAMRFSKETDEASLPFSVAGIYRGFDRDCFTVP
jgi:hypothetical protein